jgi:hypothetical protein
VHIDCDTCEVRGHACGDCVVTFLLGSAPPARSGFELDSDERAALGVLADSGLVPPLRLVPSTRSVAVSPATPTSRNAGQPKRNDMKSAG